MNQALKNVIFNFQISNLVIGIVVFHFCALGIFYTGTSWTAFLIAGFLFLIRSIGMMVGCHRLFSHQSFKTKRWVEFVLAFWATLGASGPVTRWVAHHYAHHRHSDQDDDVHSPRHGLFHAYMGWYLKRSFYEAEIPDAIKNRISPEIQILGKFADTIVLLQMVALYFFGEFLLINYPELNTNGLMLLVNAFFVPMVISLQGLFLVNLLCHLPNWGTRDFKTKDDSRNNAFVAFLTLGEGWHNGHHKFPSSARHGLLPGQWDPNFWFIKLLEALNLASDVKDASKQLIGKDNS